MSPNTKAIAVDVALCGLFVALTGAFAWDVFGRTPTHPPIPNVDPQFTNTTTVRQSAAQQIKAGGDTSGLECYACHEKGKVPVIKTDSKGAIIQPKEHEDLVMRHSRNNRNDHCFNCHDPQKLDSLKTRDGRNLKWEESTLLCAGCHGTTYRDWEVGIHGRTSGYWDGKRGARDRQECASCHHPHSPQFPSLPPAPGPNRLHPASATPHPTSTPKENAH